MRIHEFELSWRFSAPIHVGSGLSRGNCKLTETYIPGSMIRGAIGNSYIKLFCINDIFGECTISNKCMRCKYPHFFFNNQHGTGAYFTPIVPSKYNVTDVPSISLDNNLRTTMRGMLFVYQALTIPTEVLSKIYYFEEKDGTNVNEIEKSFKVAITNLHVGGRLSWGWGIPEQIELRHLTTHSSLIDFINENTLNVDQDEDLLLYVKTPLPLQEENIEKSIINSIKSMSERFFSTQISDEKLAISFDKLTLRVIGVRNSLPIIGWEQKRMPALERGSTLKLHVTPEIIDTIKLATLIGLVEDQTPFTKAGYGLIELKNIK